MKYHGEKFISVSPQISPFDFEGGTVNSGDVIMTNCLVMKGDLPIKFLWNLNGKPVEEVHGVSVTNLKRSSQLSIESVSSEHAGEYTCIANNSAGYSSYTAVLNVNGTLIKSLICYFLVYFLLFYFQYCKLSILILIYLDFLLQSSKKITI